MFLYSAIMRRRFFIHIFPRSSNVPSVPEYQKTKNLRRLSENYQVRVLIIAPDSDHTEMISDNLDNASSAFTVLSSQDDPGEYREKLRVFQTGSGTISLSPKMHCAHRYRSHYSAIWFSGACRDPCRCSSKTLDT